jgi:hypothetical protein
MLEGQQRHAPAVSTVSLNPASTARITIFTRQTQLIDSTDRKQARTASVQRVYQNRHEPDLVALGETIPAPIAPCWAAPAGAPNRSMAASPIWPYSLSFDSSLGPRLPALELWKCTWFRMVPVPLVLGDRRRRGFDVDDSGLWCGNFQETVFTERKGPDPEHGISDSQVP